MVQVQEVLTSGAAVEALTATTPPRRSRSSALWGICAPWSNGYVSQQIGRPTPKVTSIKNPNSDLVIVFMVNYALMPKPSEFLMDSWSSKRAHTKIGECRTNGDHDIRRVTSWAMGGNTVIWTTDGVSHTYTLFVQDSRLLMQQTFKFLN